MAAMGTKPDYGVDAPAVMRNLFLGAAACWLLFFATPAVWKLGPVLVGAHIMLAWTGSFLLAEAILFLVYVKYGKFKHRDWMLSLAGLKGHERVLDVGCGRGLLLAGAAKELPEGRATGIDVWSNVDMGSNSEAATLHNLQLEGVADRCELVSAGAQAMPFADNSFDVIVSNLCLHNIYDKPTRTKALAEIARVLRPGGLALLSDYKLTGEYAAFLQERGWAAKRQWGSWLTTFPPLRVVVARKPE